MPGTRTTQTIRIPGTTMRLGDLRALVEKARAGGAGDTAEVSMVTTPGDRPFDPEYTAWTITWYQADAPAPYRPDLRICFHCGKAQADHVGRWESCPLDWSRNPRGTTFSPKRPL